MISEELRLGDGLSCLIEKCPVVYFNNPDFEVIRLTTFHDDLKVSHWDIHLTIDTRYDLLFEVEQNYRSGKWVSLIDSYDANALSRFSRPSTVWLSSSIEAHQSENEIFEAIRKMNDLQVMKTQKIFSRGSIHGIFDFS